MKRLVSLFIVLTTLQVQARIEDYEYMPFLDENFKIGLGMSYSKLEANSDVGNYYLLSAANPRVEASYSSPVANLYRHRFSMGIVQELFRPENDTFILKSRESRASAYLAWQPIWLSGDKTFTKHFKFSAKNSTAITELPDTSSIYGDIGDRYSIEVGGGFTWYGLTVSKFPLGFDVEVLYSATLFDNSEVGIYNGLIYRFGIDFEFKKRSLFSGWGARGYYEYEDVKNSYSNLVDKEVGIIFSKATSF